MRQNLDHEVWGADTSQLEAATIAAARFGTAAGGATGRAVGGNLKSENSQDYGQKPQLNCMFMNSASGLQTLSQ
jgi:hypothetical protein